MHLYVHIPFCHRICPYCAFFKHTPASTDMKLFIRALAREAEARAAARKAKNFAESDRLRGEISRLGYVVEDVPGGAFRVKKA